MIHSERVAGTNARAMGIERHALAVKLDPSKVLYCPCVKVAIHYPVVPPLPLALALLIGVAEKCEQGRIIAGIRWCLPTQHFNAAAMDVMAVR